MRLSNRSTGIAEECLRQNSVLRYKCKRAVDMCRIFVQKIPTMSHCCLLKKKITVLYVGSSFPFTSRQEVVLSQYNSVAILKKPRVS